MPTISQIRVEMHRKNGRRGTFFVGNINLSASLDLDDLIVFFYPGDENEGEVAEILIEQFKDKNGNKESSPQNPRQSRHGRK